MNLNEVDVQEIDDDEFQGHKYVFRFAPNAYFEDKEIFKEFKYNKNSGDLIVHQTPIKWKPGQNLCDKGDVSKMLSGKQAGKKRPNDDTDEETSGFFAWFDEDNEDEEFIGQPMKEIWEEPVKYFAGDVEDEDDDYGEYDEDEDDDDDPEELDGEDDEGDDDDEEGGGGEDDDDDGGE